MVKLHKVIGTVTHEITLPDNVAKQMLEKHPDLYKVAEQEEIKAEDVKVSTDESTINADALAKAVTAKPRGRRRA